MTQSPLPAEVALSLAPLGAGDLIDRAIRLYRRHFFALLRIAVFPVLVSALGTVCLTIASKAIAVTASGIGFAGWMLLILMGCFLWLGGMLLQVIVMGGATRNLVTHLLWDTPVKARTTYRNVKSRLGGLIGAAILIGIAGIVISVIATFVFYAGSIVLIIATVALVQVMPEWLYILILILAVLILMLVTLLVFFFLMGHFAYVPQVMLVEGKGVFDAFGRSITLARGHIFRLMATVLFSLAASYSAVMIMIVPLGLYSYLKGYNPLISSGIDTPVWYTVGTTVVGQISAIIVAPIWMLGLSLLYVDQRVRREGYDLEVMAERQFGEMPTLRGVSPSVYTPAVSNAQGDGPPGGRPMTKGSVFGLG